MIGFVGGLLTTAALIPQVWRVYTLKSAGDLSLLFLVVTIIGIALWLVYAVQRHAWVLLFWNSMAECLVIALLVGKLKYGME